MSHFLRHVLLLEFQWWESKNKMKEMSLTVIFVSFVRRESILVFANCSACNLKITVSVQPIWVVSDRKLNICSFARYICRRGEEREVQPLANVLVSKATSSPVLFKHVCSSYTFASYFLVKLVCVIKWWRVKLLNNFIRVQIRKKLGFVQYAREIIPLFHEYACYVISY